MNRETIRDKNFRTIGYIEEESNGVRVARDRNFRVLGRYYPKEGVTRDPSFRIIARYDMLSALIWEANK